jgi:hypothetical protein
VLGDLVSSNLPALFLILLVEQVATDRAEIFVDYIFLEVLESYREADDIVVSLCFKEYVSFDAS